jgi:hypothetical protein
MKTIKTVLVALLILVSTSVFSQSTIEDAPSLNLVSASDLPIGKSFVVLPLDGSPAFAGIITKETINHMPINSPFILKVTGLEVKKYKIVAVKYVKE